MIWASTGEKADGDPVPTGRQWARGGKGFGIVAAVVAQMRSMTSVYVLVCVCVSGLCVHKVYTPSDATECGSGIWVTLRMSCCFCFPSVAIRMSLSTLEWSDRLQIANHSHTHNQSFIMLVAFIVYGLSVMEFVIIKSSLLFASYHINKKLFPSLMGKFLVSANKIHRHAQGSRVRMSLNSTVCDSLLGL